MLEQRGQRHVLGAKGEAVYRTGAQQARFTLSTAASAVWPS
ncbi:Uncharacterised protein [Klebsiella pneumoniae]|nr:Uncharacterised protein [Klebsiella pneumoniae]